MSRAILAGFARQAKLIRAHYSSPISAKDTISSAATTRWSRMVTSINLNAARSDRVKLASVVLGLQTPDRWLWANIIAAALISSTRLRTSRGWTVALSIVPSESVSNVITRCRGSRNRAQNASRGRWPSSARRKRLAAVASLIGELCSIRSRSARRPILMPACKATYFASPSPG